MESIQKTYLSLPAVVWWAMGVSDIMGGGAGVWKRL